MPKSRVVECVVQSMHDLDLSSYRHGGSEITGFSVINRHKINTYQRQFIESSHRGTRTNKNYILNVC